MVSAGMGISVTRERRVGVLIFRADDTLKLAEHCRRQQWRQPHRCLHIATIYTCARLGRKQLLIWRWYHIADNSLGRVSLVLGLVRGVSGVGHSRQAERIKRATLIIDNDSAWVVAEQCVDRCIAPCCRLAA